ncbi:cytochrome P450 [Rhodocollybia butyracea]|uniref:Cytochrome P450 n=1 Tax=Rhodocollybia butyracea TaxID=206335 RepID=A0A9P5PI93_9AGAR|nr:cytochrome P450 [Rhodocollybia butyracea]
MYLLLFCSALFYVGTVALYRLFFHPLRKYPGPVLAAFTEGYEMYYNIVKGGGLVIQIEKLHKIHGPVIRIGPNTLHFNYKQAYHDIYTYGSTLTKSPEFYQSVSVHSPEGSFAFCDPHESRNRRALLAPLFSRRGVVALEYTIQEKVGYCTLRNYNSQNASVDMHIAFRAVTIDIITSYCFAQSANALEVANLSHPFLQSVQGLFKTLWFQRHFPFLTSLVDLVPLKLVLWLLPLYSGYSELRLTFQRQIDSLIDEPSSLSSADHEIIYHHLLEPKNQERPSRSSLVNEAFTLVTAGSDTVANVCHIGTFYALTNPLVLRNLSKELCDAWPDKDTPMSYVTLEKLPYLTAFIKETLRLSFGIVHPLPRVINTSTSTIGGMKVPAGTIVEMSHLFLHMNPDVFTDPHTFNPDRWLVENTSEMMHDLATFSKGPRICLAWCELYLIFGNLFRKLDLTLLPDNDSIKSFRWEDHEDYLVPRWSKGYRVFAQKLK